MKLQPQHQRSKWIFRASVIAFSLLLITVSSFYLYRTVLRSSSSSSSSRNNKRIHLAAGEEEEDTSLRDEKERIDKNNNNENIDDGSSSTNLGINAFSLDGNNNLHQNRLEAEHERRKAVQKQKLNQHHDDDDSPSAHKSATTSLDLGRVSIPKRLISSLSAMTTTMKEEDDLMSQISIDDPIFKKSSSSSSSFSSSSSSNPSNLDVELFVIWYDALHKSHKILADMRKKFLIVAIEYFDWSSHSHHQRQQHHSFDKNNNKKNNNEAEEVLLYQNGNADSMSRHQFQTNLWRLYSGKGGWERVGMDKKVKQCGFGPFIAIVVVDPKPDYRDEVTAHGIDHVNHNINAAKKLYRSWTGGGFRVHGTFGPQESSHDIPILFHRDADDYAEILRQRILLRDQEKTIGNMKKNKMKMSKKKMMIGTKDFVQHSQNSHLPLVDRFVKTILALNDYRLHHQSLSSSSAGKLPKEDNQKEEESSVGIQVSLAELLEPESLSFSGDRKMNKNQNKKKKSCLDPLRDVDMNQLSLSSLSRSSSSSSPSLDEICGDFSSLFSDVEHFRDEIFQNEFYTHRATLGYSGWSSCRDFLLSLKSFQNIKIYPTASSSSSDNMKKRKNRKSLLCIPCEKWPLEITIEIEKDDEKQSKRWAISALQAGAGSTSDKETFEVPFFLNADVEKRVTRKIKIVRN